MERPSSLLVAVWAAIILMAAAGLVVAGLDRLPMLGHVLLFIFASSGLVYWGLKIAAHPLYILGVVAMVSVIAAGATPFLSLFPETTLPVATGAAAEGAMAGAGEFLTLFLPSIIGVAIVVPLATRTRFGRAHESTMILIALSAISMGQWMLMKTMGV